MDASEQNESEVNQIDNDDVIQEEDETEKEEGEDLTEDAEALKAELAKIVVHPPSYEVLVYLFCMLYRITALSTRRGLLSSLISIQCICMENREDKRPM